MSSICLASTASATRRTLGAVEEHHPIRLVVTDDLRRSRLTVFFRLFLAIPHLIWLTLWTLVGYFVLIANWFATLFAGQSPDSLHNFTARLIRYMTHVYAYMYLVANPFPPFGGRRGTYPVDLEIDPPARQGRLGVLFRIILVIPAWVLGTVLQYLLQILAFLGWFVCLVLGRMPEGMRNLSAFCLRYYAQTQAYLWLLTSRYPSLGGGSPTEAPAPRSAASS